MLYLKYMLLNSSVFYPILNPVVLYVVLVVCSCQIMYQTWRLYLLWE